MASKFSRSPVLRLIVKSKLAKVWYSATARMMWIKLRKLQSNLGRRCEPPRQQRLSILIRRKQYRTQTAVAEKRNDSRMTAISPTHEAHSACHPSHFAQELILNGSLIKRTIGVNVLL